MRKISSAVLVILAALTVISAPAADFTGDGRDNIAIFRPSSGLWAVRGYTRAYFGTAGDIPAPGKWDQGARDQIAIFRPSSGLWAVQGGARNYFGTAGDIPLGFGGGSDWVRNGNKIYYNQGSVGIGSTNPNYRLQLHTRDSNHSYLQFTNTSTRPGHLDGVLVGLDPAENFRIHSYENNSIQFHIDNVERMRIASDGKVGIGTANPEAKLHVHSTDLSPALIIRGGSNIPPNQWLARFYDAAGTEQFRFAGSGWGYAKEGWGTISDERMKDNIADADSASELIDAIRVRQFDWKDSGVHQRYGLVAQELVEVAPEAVAKGATEEDMWGVDNSKLVPILVKEIQDQRKEIQDIRARLARLENL